MQCGGAPPPRRPPRRRRRAAPAAIRGVQPGPDHGSRISDQSREEARTALDLQQQGRLPGDLQRPPRGGEGDFWSPSRKEYFDIKQVTDTGLAEFNPAKFEESIGRQIQIIGRTPVIDTRNASQQAIDQAQRIIERRGWGDDVIWYP